jgi:hypothetical protein
MADATHIKCPDCGREIDVNEILYHQLEDKIGKKYNSKLVQQQKQFEEKQLELRKEREKLDKQKSELEESIEKSVKSKLSAEKTKMEKNLRAQLNEEKSEEIKTYQDELEKKTAESKEFNKMKADFSRLQREKSELKEKIEAESEQKLNTKLGEEKERIRKELEEKNQLKVSEKDHVIEQLMEQLKEAQRKAEQGSTQTQGEVQELAIEDWLRTNFPLDTIEEIKKGVRGADCLQHINTRTKQNCGSIYYESKRTKDFQPSWIEKFKSDMREKEAAFGILVTEAYPKGMDRVGQKDGVWVCTFEEFKGLCFVIRESVILISSASDSQEDKGDKMVMLYDFLTGNEFRMRVEAIVEGFSQMHNDLTREKRSMESMWKQREKQIQKVLQNTTKMYGSIKGIAGSSVAAIKALELPSPDELPNTEDL